MLCETLRYDVVSVYFNSSSARSNTYMYKMHASMKPAIGDVVIVDSPNSNLVTCTVLRVLGKNEYGADKATKWVVDKVNCDLYNKLLAADREKQQARENAALMAQRVVNIEQLMLALPTGSKARKLLAQAVKAL